MVTHLLKLNKKDSFLILPVCIRCNKDISYNNLVPSLLIAFLMSVFPLQNIKRQLFIVQSNPIILSRAICKPLGVGDNTPVA